MIRILGVGALAATLAGCEVTGSTCGRGRCPDGTECVSALSRSDQYNGNTIGEVQSRVDNEWWCVTPCSDKGVSCPGGVSHPFASGSATACLMDPADHQRTVCATNTTVSIAYHSGEKSAGFTGTTVPICSTFSVASFTIGSGTTRCMPETKCAAGSFSPGQTVPDRVIARSTSGTDYWVPILGITTGTVLPSLLPKGEQIVIYTSYSKCPD